MKLDVQLKSVHFKIELLASSIFNITSADIKTNAADVILKMTEGRVTRS